MSFLEVKAKGKDLNLIKSCLFDGKRSIQQGSWLTHTYHPTIQNSILDTHCGSTELLYLVQDIEMDETNVCTIPLSILVSWSTNSD